jgi:4,5-DOPA dioxygenase extradiol
MALMAKTTYPSIFISHGSPMIALEPGEAGAYMERLGRQLGKPDAIVAVSAHTTAREPVLMAGTPHQAVYDFGGFDPKLFTLRYDAPGAPDVAPRVASLLQAAGLPAHVVNEGGLDHGIWTSLRYLYPDADIPVLPLAFVPTQSPAQQFRLGEALAPLRQQGVLVLGTGSITHNLRRVFAGGLRPPGNQPEIPESAAFRDWMLGQSRVRDWDALFDYRRRAPYAVDMHPTDEHLLPWYVAAGAGGRDSTPVRLHGSVTYGAIGMDLYAFGPEAETLRPQ